MIMISDAIEGGDITVSSLSCVIQYDTAHIRKPRYAGVYVPDHTTLNFDINSYSNTESQSISK